MNPRICAIVPSHNHHREVARIVDRLGEYGLTVFLIDDASAEPAREVLASLAASRPEVRLHRFARNRGKGGAVIKGMELARAEGFTHALQVDADGQHDLASTLDFLAACRQHPAAVINGVPRFDRSAPMSRRVGRLLTTAWVAVETLSLSIHDAMCGFRVYPLTAVQAVCARRPLAQGMGFDIDILVRLATAGTQIVNLPVAVTYPPENTSNFHVWRDNVAITRLHARLVLRTAVQLLRGEFQRPAGSNRHWATIGERGAYGGLRLLAATHRLLGRDVCIAFMSPVILYFYLTGREQRRASRHYLQRVFQIKGAAREPGRRDEFRQFMSFGAKVLDSFAAWTAAMPDNSVIYDDPEAIRRMHADPRGALLLVSHFGNAELSRAVITGLGRRRLTVLMHTKHAENYNRLLQRFSPDVAVNVLQVTELGPDTAIALHQRIQSGDWVAIAADRTPVGGGRVATAPFLGQAAPFSQGPFVLAHLLGCPVYSLFCLRQGRQHRLWIRTFAERIELPRAGREQALADWVGRYAAELQEFVLRDPFQWYNFFDFWDPSKVTNRS